MYNLFNEEKGAYTGEINVSQLNYIKGNLVGELNKLVNYYRNNVHAVPTNHLLMRFISAFPVSVDLDNEIYYNRIVEYAEDLVRTLRISSSVNRGKTFDGVIYGEGTEEVFVSVVEDYDNYRDVPWTELKPIRVLSHPRTSLFFNPVKSEPFENEIGFAVFTLDVPMLMMQYKKWRIDPNSYYKHDSDRSIMQFLALYPLPNILFSHMDVAIFNRLSAWKYGSAPNTAIPHFPVAVINYSDKIDRVLITLNDLFDRQKKDFVNVLRNVPAVSSENYLEVIRIPPMAITRYIQWALLLSRIPTMKYLCRQAKEANVQRNQTERNEILRELREMKNDRSMEQMVSPRQFKVIMKMINEDIVPNL